MNAHTSMHYKDLFPNLKDPAVHFPLKPKSEWQWLTVAGARAYKGKKLFWVMQQTENDDYGAYGELIGEISRKEDDLVLLAVKFSVPDRDGRIYDSIIGGCFERR
jgi:hypothetical protein